MTGLPAAFRASFKGAFSLPILDFHTHAYPERIAPLSATNIRQHYRLEVHGTGLIDDLKARAAEAGVDYMVVLAVASKPGQGTTVNNWLAKHTGGGVIGFGGLHPHCKHLQDEMARVQALGMRGIKLHPDFQRVPADDTSYDPIYDFAAQTHLPVLVHSGDVLTPYSSPARIAAMIRRFPNVTFIVPHLGGYSEWDESERHIIGQNCYIDTSSALWALPPEKARELIRRHGAEHVLFGTDYPIRTQKEELALLHGLRLTDEEERLILFENAKRLLGL